MMSVDLPFNEAVVQFVSMDVDALPGRHPERVQSDALRERVEHVIAELDAIRPDESSENLFDWAEREVDRLALAHPELSLEAREALISLLSFTWR